MSDKRVRAQHTREDKLEAVRQVRGGQSIAYDPKLVRRMGLSIWRLGAE